MGAALEDYIKDIFAGTVDETDLNVRNRLISETFCYLGNPNNRKHPIKYPFSLLYFHCTFAFAILHELLTYFHYDTRTI